MNACELGKRLRLAREARGLSQQAVADTIGLPRTAVTQMEAGKRSVSTLELSSLSRLFLRPVSEILRERSGDEDEDVLGVLYRVAPGLEQDPSTYEQVARCIGLCREGVTLKTLLGASPRSGPPSYEMRMPGSSGEAVTQGERTAEQERRRLGIGNAPVADISELISSQGIWASGIELPAGVSGLFLQHQSTGPTILVNASHPRCRKRFSYAHEYAHALLDRERNVTVSNADNSSDMVERRANAFAAAFLMPRIGVHEALRSMGKGLPSRQYHAGFDAASGDYIETKLRPPEGSQQITCFDIARLAHHFGTSYLTALYRHKNLRYISNPEFGKLLRQEALGREYLKSLDMLDDVGEPSRYWDRELRGEITYLAIEAYRRNEISRGRILELSRTLGIDSDVLLRLAHSVRGK